MTGQRPHGRAKYIFEKCRCDICRDAVRTYERNRHRQRGYGRTAYVDAEPARQHVRRLGEFGIGQKRVSELAGVPYSTMWKLIYGDRARFAGPSKRIRPETERKILSVEATLDNVADGSLVDATGTRRRLQALVAIGWSQSKLGSRLGVDPTNMSAMIRVQRIHPARARAVRALYDELWQTLPPRSGHRDKIAYNRSRRFAAKHGWAPPLAWDDDEIDDPTAQPAGVPDGKRRPGGQPKLPPADELRWLLEQESPRSVARRFGVRLDAIDNALRRSA